MMRSKPLIDDMVYSVVGINGFRQGNLTRQQAIETAKRMRQQMADAGWAGKVEVYYRDGSRVKNES